MKIEDQYDHMLNRQYRNLLLDIIKTYPKVMLTILRKLRELNSDRFGLMRFEDSAVFQDGIPKFSFTAPIALSITTDLLNSAKLNESKFLGLIRIPPSLTSKL